MGQKVGKGIRKKELDSIKNLYSRGIVSKAMAEAERYVEKYPDDMFGHFLYAKLLKDCGEQEAALKEYQIVYNADENNKYSSLVAMAGIYEDLEDRDKAMSYYRKAIKESPYLEKFAILRLAHLERKRKNFEEAIKLMDLLDEHDETAQIEKARNLILLNRLDEATEILDNITPQTEEIKRDLALGRGCIAKMKEKYAEAHKYILEAQGNGKKDRIYYSAILEEAKVLMKEDNYTEALEICKELLNDNHAFDKEVYLMSAICYQNLGYYDKAQSNCHIAATSQDDDISSIADGFLGVYEYAKGNIEDAEKLIRKSLSKSKKPIIRRYAYLINILINSGRIDEADQIVSDLISSDKRLLRDAEMFVIRIIVDKKKGRNLEHYQNPKYLPSQIISYDKDKALEHIITNHRDNEEKSNFSKTIDIESLFEEIKVHMTKENKVLKSAIDTYEIDYPNVGYRDGKIINKINVVAVPGTLDIITMYPKDDIQTPRLADIKKSEETQQVLTKKNNSRTDRFYQKYNSYLNANKKQGN